MFFSEEKNQKTFIFWLLPNSPAMSRIYPWAPEAKVFWFFSSEKNILCCFARGYFPAPFVGAALPGN
jgi:hypothetical protein